MKSTCLRVFAIICTNGLLLSHPCAGNETEPESVWAQAQQVEIAHDLLSSDEERRYHAFVAARRLGPERMADDVRLTLMTLLTQIYNQYDAASAEGIARNEVVNVEFTNSIVELVSELSDPRSIAVLVRSGGYGYSKYAAQRLSSFGEAALPALSGVLEKTEAPDTAIGFTLRVLRMMVEEKGVGGLSDSNREDIVRAAAEGLGRDGVSSLNNAVRLAAALNHPELNRILVEIQNDAGELESRGLSSATATRIRRAAAESVAGLKP